ncbi:MAG: calcium-binding protein [Solirubrobacterales bacterium]
MPASLPLVVALLAVLAATLVAPLGAGGARAAAPPPTPSCAEGPRREGDTIQGTPCADTIVVPGSVLHVDGGGGNDTIIGARSAAVLTGPCESGCHLLVGSQTFEGGPGDDVVYGDRGNDILRGNGGNDRLYGGIGDDVLEGGPGNDLLSGGFGADKIDGEEGDDYVRGDPTVDHIYDSGGGFDTLSFATGATPGFTALSNPTGAEGFPGPEGERGVWLKLNEGGTNAIDGEPSLGGGNDEIQPGAFERIIGTPFSDYIVGSAAAEEIWGGGGADVIEGGGGADQLHGGADGDYLVASSGATIDGDAGSDNCVGGAATANCEGTAERVGTRDAAKVSVGETVTPAGLTQVYVVGSTGADEISLTYGGSGEVAVALGAGGFDTSAGDAGGCTVSATAASCPVSGRLDAVLLAGMAGADTIRAEVPDGVGVFELGGDGEDHLLGSGSEDVLVDGPGGARDVLEAGPGDDALTHNGGPDLLDGGPGSDLFLSVSICDGETIDGGAETVGAPIPDRDNASWARFGASGVDARIDQGRVGQVGPGGEPQCPGNRFDALARIEDLEGSNQDDYLVGDAANNQLLGHKGHDTYFSLAGQDSILANSGSSDLVIDCGPDYDAAVIDLASVAPDPTPIECESVREGAVEEFREAELVPPPPPPKPPPPVDVKPPRTLLTHHPPRLVFTRSRHRRVAFRFASSEAGSTFRCRLDRKPFRPCRSPRVFGVSLGRHTVRIRAVDAAGNADRSPAVFHFRVRRRPAAPASR